MRSAVGISGLQAGEDVKSFLKTARPGLDRPQPRRSSLRCLPLRLRPSAFRPSPPLSTEDSDSPGCRIRSRISG